MNFNKKTFYFTLFIILACIVLIWLATLWIVGCTNLVDDNPEVIISTTTSTAASSTSTVTGTTTTTNNGSVVTTTTSSSTTTTDSHLPTAWSPLNSGVDDVIFNLAADNGGEVFAGGKFLNANGLAVHHVAKWTADGWSNLQIGPDDDVYALAFDGFSNFLYVGGAFITVEAYLPENNITANYVAKWNGESWEKLGIFGLNDQVYALETDWNLGLYAGGAFTFAETGEVDHIARWNGTVWESMNGDFGGPQGNVRALFFDSKNSHLYVGGEFDIVGTLEANHIAIWNAIYPGGWLAVGDGLNGTVRALVYDTERDILYVGGDFTYTINSGSPDLLVNYIVKRDGSGWSALTDYYSSGVGLNGPVLSLALDHDGNLYASGSFNGTSNVANALKGVAMWNGAYWTPLNYTLSSGGNTPEVHSFIYVSNYDELYAGGSFTSIDGYSFGHIGKRARPE